MGATTIFSNQNRITALGRTVTGFVVDSAVVNKYTLLITHGCILAYSMFHHRVNYQNTKLTYCDEIKKLIYNQQTARAKENTN